MLGERNKRREGENAVTLVPCLLWKRVRDSEIENGQVKETLRIRLVCFVF